MLDRLLNSILLLGDLTTYFLRSISVHLFNYSDGVGWGFQGPGPSSMQFRGPKGRVVVARIRDLSRRCQYGGIEIL